MHYVQDVKRFHDKFGLVTPSSFTRLEDSLHKFRTGFFVEELQEYDDAVQAKDLSTALDSLIDLIYIISGASLLHGIEANELYAAGAIVDDFFDDSSVLREGLTDEEPTKIALPEEYPSNMFVGMMTAYIEAYNKVHEDDELDIETRHQYVKFILAAMFNSTIMAAYYCGCTDDLWNELWDDVQRANMSKVRAEKASDSKRGSTWDVVKPAGWVPPQTDAIIAKHQAL